MNLSTMSVAMAIVNFSVPEDVKTSFDETFRGQNKSAIIAQLMREAVEREQRRRESARAAERVRARHATSPVRTQSKLRQTRVKGRP
jgi:hypothetical protein